MPNHYATKEFKLAVAKHTSIRQVLLALGLKPAGGNYRTVHHLVKRLQLNTSHWTGQGYLRGGTNPFAPTWPLKKILVKRSKYRGSNNRLKRRLLTQELLTNCCAVCGLRNWRKKPLSLHLDHINGARDDYRLENLRLLCPNCHSQTPTYCGKNKGK